jgi:hypothetical protein
MTQKKLKNGTLERKWLYSRWLACLIGVMVCIGGLAQTFDIMPASVNSPFGGGEVWVRLFGFTSFIFLAAFNPFIARGTHTPAYSSRFYFAPSPLEYLWSVCFVIVASILIVLLIRQLQRHRRFFKWLIYIHLWLYVVMWVFGMRDRGGNPVDFYRLYFDSRCETQLSDTLYIRLDVYDSDPLENTIGYDFNSIVYVSHDAGQTWQEITHLVGYISRCDQNQLNNVGYLDKDLVWLWTPQALLFSHDNGATWQYWLPDRYNFPSFISASITDVTFTGSEHGTIAVQGYDYSRHVTRNGELETTDGGQSWQLVAWRGDFGN